jgi:hypothetical protein
VVGGLSQGRLVDQAGRAKCATCGLGALAVPDRQSARAPAAQRSAGRGSSPGARASPHAARAGRRIAWRSCAPPPRVPPCASPSGRSSSAARALTRAARRACEPHALCPVRRPVGTRAPAPGRASADDAGRRSSGLQPGRASRRIDEVHGTNLPRPPPGTTTGAAAPVPVHFVTTSTRRRHRSTRSSGDSTRQPRVTRGSRRYPQRLGGPSICSRARGGLLRVVRVG